MELKLDEIIREWSYRTETGIPDIKNYKHIRLLSKILEELNYPQAFIFEYIGELMMEANGEGVAPIPIRTKKKKKVDFKTEEIILGTDKLEGKAPIATNSNVKEIQEMIIGLGQILSEVSIWDNKYSIGDKFLSLKNTPAQFVKGLPPGEKAPDEPFVKVNPAEDAIEVDLGGSIIVYMKSEANGKTYKITGKDTDIHPMFGKMQKGAVATDVKWKDSSMETAACLGLYMDGVAMQQKLLKTDSEDLPGVLAGFRGEVSSTLGKSDQFQAPSAISGKLNTMSLANWYRLAALAAGMTKFKEGVVSFSGPFLVHKDIEKYYTAVNKNNLVSGIKKNTSDAVVSSVPASELINAIENGKVTFDGNGICTIEGTGIKFIQVSLKKVAGGAQLGKVYSYLKDKYDLLSTKDVLRLAIKEEIIEEGLKDFFKKGVEFIKSVGKAFLQTLKALGDFANKIGKKIRSGLNSKGAPGEVKKLFKEIRKKALKESLITEGTTIWDQLGEIGNDPVALKIVITNINKQLGIISGIAKKNSGFHYSGVTALNTPASATADDVGKLLSNYQTTFVLRNLLNNTAGDGTELYKKLIDMEKEMIYGKTTLPLYKVYGLDEITGGGTAYTRYPGSEEFIKSKMDIDTSNAVVFYIQCNSTDKHLTMNSWALAGLKEFMYAEEPELIYSKYRMGTNDSGRYSYNFEGTTEMSIDKVKKTLGIS